MGDLYHEPSFEEKIGQLIVIGFHGVSPEDASVRKVMDQARAGKIGGVILYRYNIQGPAQLKGLMAAMGKAPGAYPLFTFVDQEGGKVQRLDPEKGFTGFSSAKKVAETMSPDRARKHYSDMGAMLKEYGFNFDFAPCVDLDGDPPCEVIGKLERSYGDSLETIAEYARAMIHGLHDHGILSCLKHYPGHGRARGDSHMGLVDITGTWREEELAPYESLVKSGCVDAVMTAHLLHNEIDPETPPTFSEKWIGRLRNDIGFDGLVVPDDFHMGAILSHYTLEQIVIQGLAAGLDLLLFSNNPLAAKALGIRQDTQSKVFGNSSVPDPDLPEKIIKTAADAVAAGTISEERIDQAFGRVVALKKRMQAEPA